MKMEGKWLTLAGALVSLGGLIVNFIGDQISDKKTKEYIRDEVKIALTEAMNKKK